MTLVQRRLLSAFFFLSFFIISPIIILYASGYRFSGESKQLERVGLLFVSTTPGDSTVIVEGKEYQARGDLLIDDLEAKDYDIQIQKSGYHTWKKELEVREGQSTMIRDLELFLQSEPEKVQSYMSSIANVNENSIFLVSQANEMLVAYNKETQEYADISLPTNDIITDSRLSPVSSTLTIKQQSGWSKVNLLNGTVEPIELPSPLTDVESIIVAEDSTYFIHETNVYRSVGDAEPTPLSNTSFAIDISTTEQGFWYLATEPSKQRLFLYEYNNDDSRPQLITSLPYADDLRIVDDFNGFLTLFSANNQSIYLIDTSVLPAVVEGIYGINSWEWSNDHRSLLTTSEFEVAIYHIENGIRQELISRISSPIVDASWYANEQFVIYATDTSIFMTERDVRDVQNVFNLVSNVKTPSLVHVDPTGAFVEFYSNNQNVGTTLWRLPLKE